MKANHAFLAELNAAVKAAGLENMLGLGMRHRDSIRSADMCVLKEKTFGEGSAAYSILKAVKSGERPGTIPTHWSYDAARRVPIADCCCRASWQCRDD